MGVFTTLAASVLHIDGFVSYDDILLVDKEGDNLYGMPHLYVDFLGPSGPFAGELNFLEFSGRRVQLTDEWTRTNFFPKQFSKPKPSRILKDKIISLDENSLAGLRNYRQETEALYCTDDRYSYLRSRDIVSISDPKSQEPEYVQITSVYEMNPRDYLARSRNEWRLAQNIRQQLGREYDENEPIRIYEFKRAYKWQVEESGKS